MRLHIRPAALLAAAALLGAAAAPAARAYEPGPPTASWYYSPSMPRSGDVVTFTSTAWSEGSFFCDYDPWITSWQWDLDGNVSYETSGEVVTHVYNLPGPVVVTHHVTDECGKSDTQSQLLVIGPKSSVGGGEAGGSVHFSGAGVPPAGAPCTQAGFTLSGTSEAFVVHTVGTEFAGPVALSGTGSSPCETATVGSGTLTLGAHGSGPTGGTIDCAGLVGSYSRVGTDVGANLSGTCVVNGYSFPVTFVFHGAFEPTPAGAGVTTAIRDASWQGAFAVASA